MRNLAGGLIQQFRLQMEPRFTQAQMAQALQLKGMTIDRSGVSKIENGYRRLSDIEIVCIADVLGVSPGQLLPPVTDPEIRRVIKLTFKPPSVPSE